MREKGYKIEGKAYGNVVTTIEIVRTRSSAHCAETTAADLESVVSEDFAIAAGTLAASTSWSAPSSTKSMTTCGELPKPNPICSISGEDALDESRELMSVSETRLGAVERPSHSSSGEKRMPSCEGRVRWEREKEGRRGEGSIGNVSPLCIFGEVSASTMTID
jgi:hypothetical protein